MATVQDQLSGLFKPAIFIVALAAPFASTAQTNPLTFGNLKGDVARVTGKPVAKTIAQMVKDLKSAPAPTQAPVATFGKTDQPYGFNAAYYAKSNPDVTAIYGANGFVHYQKHGKWEGRLPYEGAKPWRPDETLPPAEWADAPACEIEAADAWVPAGARQVRIRFKVTRFKGERPCERSYSIIGGGINPNAEQVAEVGRPGLNITGQATMMAVDDALVLPSTGSEGELVFNLPDWAQREMSVGWFNAYLRTAEYNPRVDRPIKVFVGGERPAGSQYHVEPLVLRDPTPYPTNLGTAHYTTDFKSLDGWRFSPGVQLNAMIGVFTTPDWKTASGKLTDNYPWTNGVRQIVMRDHRTDPVQGKYLFSTGLMSRTLGDGRYGYRAARLNLPEPLPGTDAAYWGIKPDGSWPPEFDTQEGFYGNPGRMAQTIHMPVYGAPTHGFSPRVNVYGTHDWMEYFGETTYRLWIDKRLVIERPNYLAGIPFDTTFGNEGPGGAGGAADLSQPYDGMTMSLHSLAWWQR